MDPITHAALGATCAQLLLGTVPKSPKAARLNREDKVGKHVPWLIGALAAMAPDLDVFIHFAHDPLSGEFWHRNFSHSFLFAPLGALMVFLLSMCIRPFRRHWQTALGAAFIGYISHGLLDACTSYGTLLLWPWSYVRISWDMVAIVDLKVTIPLILGLVAAVTFQQKKWALMGLFWFFLVLMFNAVQHQRSLQSLEKFALQKNITFNDVRALPAFDSSTQWRIIAKTPNKTCLLIADAYTPLGRAARLVPRAVVPLYAISPAYQEASSSPKNKGDLALFAWFSDNYLVLENPAPLILADGRYTLGNQPLFALWGVELSAQGQAVRQLSNLPLTASCREWQGLVPRP